MPTYSYRCTECGTAFDIHQSFTDDSLTVCPTCGGVLRKVFSPVGVTFSGSGFYRTDSRAESSGSQGSGSKKSSSSESSSSKESSNSKPAAAASPAPATPAPSKPSTTKE